MQLEIRALMMKFMGHCQHRQMQQHARASLLEGWRFVLFLRMHKTLTWCRPTLDLVIEEDLIEEVARVYGFDRIPETDPATVVAIPALSETKLSPESVADLLIQRGYFEAITYSFVDPALQAVLCPGEPALRRIQGMP